MTIVPGNLETDGDPTKIRGSFRGENRQFTFHGTSDTELPNFSVTIARFVFDSLFDLEGPQDFQGSIKDGKVQINFENTFISGSVKGSEHDVNFRGTGTWQYD